MRLLKKLKKKLVRWLLCDEEVLREIELPFINVRDLIVDPVIVRDYVDLAQLTSDPTLTAGRMWARDTGELKFTPNGSITKTIWPPEVDTVNKGGSDVTVTETSETLKQEVTPDSGYKYFTYIEGVHIVANNPSGSGVTLYLQARALLDDDSEVNLSDWVEVAEGSSFDDWLRWIYDAIPGGRTIKAIRLYAYCSTTPTSGSEPTARIDKVVGLQT